MYELEPETLVDILGLGKTWVRGKKWEILQKISIDPYSTQNSTFLK
jgi:hypothetical protein